MADVIGDRIELVPGALAPKARITGHRIRVLDIVIWHKHLGMSADEIVAKYATLTLADVSAALSYYSEHRAEIDCAIAESDAFVEEVRRSATGPLEEKLKHRRSG